MIFEIQYLPHEPGSSEKQGRAQIEEYGAQAL